MKIPCVVYFVGNKDDVIKTSTINPHTGIIYQRFTGLEPKSISFEYHNIKYKYPLYGLGGKYFMKEYENSPFYRAFKLNLSLPEDKPDNTRKIKI